MVASSTASSSSPQPGPLQLPGQQVAAGDEDLLLVGVAVEAHDVHAVEQRRRDGVEHVGRGDEDDLGQVEVELEVVVAERVVLRRVEHLEQGGGRVARPRAGAELVDLVEQHDGVHRAGLGDRLHDAARLRPDVGAPVAADLGLVAHAAEGDAHELAAHGPGDRLAERRLADARGPDQRDDRAMAALMASVARSSSDASALDSSLGSSLRLAALALVAQLAHGEELDDARLHVGQAVVVGVEDLLGRRQVDGVVAADAPRQLEDPVQPRADPALLG